MANVMYAGGKLLGMSLSQAQTTINAGIPAALDWKLNTANPQTGSMKVVAALVTSGFTVNADHYALGDTNISGNELVGTGYARKDIGGTAGAGTATYQTASDRVELDAPDLVYTAISAGTAAGILLFLEKLTSPTDATRVLLCFIDQPQSAINGFPAVTNGGDLTIQWATTGIIWQS